MKKIKDLIEIIKVYRDYYPLKQPIKNVCYILNQNYNYPRFIIWILVVMIYNKKAQK